MTIKYHPDIPQ